MTDVELHPRLLVPAVLLALEEMTEEPLLQVDAVIRVVVCPVLDAVHLEPLLLRCRLEEALEIAARMQRLSAPIRGRQQGHLDLRPVGKHSLVVLVVHGMSEIGLAEIVAVAAQRFVRERLRSRDPVAVHAAAIALGAQSILNGLDLHVVPVLGKGIVDAAVVAELAIEVGKTLPDADRREMFWLHTRHFPLVDGVVRDATQADLAVRPGLPAGPLNAIEQVLGLTRRPVLYIAGRTTAAT